MKPQAKIETITVLPDEDFALDWQDVVVLTERTATGYRLHVLRRP